MKIVYTFSLIFVFTIQSCGQNIDSVNIDIVDTVEVLFENYYKDILNKTGTSIQTRFLPPSNFERISNQDNSYAKYLRNLPLKPNGTEVMLYNGNYKPNYNVYDAVVDLKIGKRNLHQCADAVMRLRAEFLWTNKRYDEIHFNFTNGFRVDYSKWMQGYRVAINGNKTNWVKRTQPSNTYKDFWKYMEIVFSYAGTLSLSKELIPVEKQNMKIGDVFIWGGSPGHAILVIDMVVNPNTKEKLFLLAQSYMPAQEIQILKNPNNSNYGPWYSLKNLKTELITPEWNFDIVDLKRF